MRSNLQVLIAQHNQQRAEGPRVTLRSLAKELGISKYTIYAFSNNQLNEYPVVMLERLCTFFDCSPGDLLTLRDVPDEPSTA